MSARCRWSSAGSATICAPGTARCRPGVEAPTRTRSPITWSVAGVDARRRAYVVSQRDGRAGLWRHADRPAVVHAIQDLKARGLAGHASIRSSSMDIPAGNALPDPYSRASIGQPAYPWRGRITCTPAPGQPGIARQDAARAAQVAAFFGDGGAGDFAVAGETVALFRAGGMELPAAWCCTTRILRGGGRRRRLPDRLGAARADAVRSSASELSVRRRAGALAADVRGVLGPARRSPTPPTGRSISGTSRRTAAGDVYFHLDPLWARRAIDFVGIDIYKPLSDWRDGAAISTSRRASARSTISTICAATSRRRGLRLVLCQRGRPRRRRTRTPITDGAYGKPWVFRFKDIAAWWSNPHYDRPGGVESGDADGLGAAVEADLVHRARLPGGRQGRQPAERVLRSEDSESRRCRISRAARATTSSSAATSRRCSAFFDPEHPASRRLEPDLAGLWRPHGRSRSHLRLGLGRAALSGLPSRSDIWSDGGELASSAIG